MKKGWRLVKRVICLLAGIFLVFLLGMTAYNQFCRWGIHAELATIGQQVEVNGKTMRIEKAGAGEQTVILLSGLGTYEPILDFKPLTAKLVQDYQVVTIDYPGYGLSEDTTEERSSENIVAEVREALKQAGVEPPYILMPHSLSGFYAMEYVKEYPEEVTAVIGIEPSVPNQEKYEESSIISTGAWYLTRAMDIIGETRLELREDKLLADMRQSGSYSEQELDLITEVKAGNSASRALINENNAIAENAKKLYDLKYPENLPVLTFLSKESCESMKEEFAKRGVDTSWEILHTEVFSNPEIQKISFLEGSHYLHWTSADAIAKQTKQFVNDNVE